MTYSKIFYSSLSLSLSLSLYHVSVETQDQFAPFSIFPPKRKKLYSSTRETSMLAFFHRSPSSRLSLSEIPPKIWSESNRKISITIDFTSPLKKIQSQYELCKTPPNLSLLLIQCNLDEGVLKSVSSSRIFRTNFLAHSIFSCK